MTGSSGRSNVIASLDPDVARFIDTFIVSVAELDVLAHLAKEPSLRALPREISRVLAFVPAIVELWVDDLATKGLVVVNDDGTVTYAPQDVDRARAVERTVQAYRTHRVAVVAQIIAERHDDDEAEAEPPVRPVRPVAHPGRALSDAFRLRKDEP